MRQNPLDGGVIERQRQFHSRSVYFGNHAQTLRATLVDGGRDRRDDCVVLVWSGCRRATADTKAPSLQAGAAQTPNQTPVTIDDVLALKSVASAMVSPDGTQVLYTVRGWEQEGDRMESRTRIWKVAVAGGPARQITFGERGDAQPQWSPDGRHISFVSARGSGSGDDAPKAQIYVMRTDGGEAWKLTDAKENVASYSWAPDSSRIAYVTTEPRSADQEAAIRNDGTTPASSRATSVLSTSGLCRSIRRQRQGRLA
jgi:hypothetical protein